MLSGKELEFFGNDFALNGPPSACIYINGKSLCIGEINIIESFFNSLCPRRIAK
jgi:hypothetical protein